MIKLELGKEYRTRNGRKVGPLEHNRWSFRDTHPFAGYLGLTRVSYRPDGGYMIAGDGPDCLDIVAEWTDEAAVDEVLHAQDDGVGDALHYVAAGTVITANTTAPSVGAAKPSYLPIKDGHTYVLRDGRIATARTIPDSEIIDLFDAKGRVGRVWTNEGVVIKGVHHTPKPDDVVAELPCAALAASGSIVGQTIGRLSSSEPVRQVLPRETCTCRSLLHGHENGCPYLASKGSNR